MKSLLLVLCTATAALASPATDRLGLQLWSLRTEITADPAAGLKHTAALGFTRVETAGVYGRPAADFRAQLTAAGLSVAAAHIQYERLRDDLPGAIAEAKALGAEWIVLPWVPYPEFDPALAARLAEEFNRWGAAIHAAGLRFAFHPHGFEFTIGANGETPFDLLVGATDPKLVSFEMDTFWVAHAGVDPVKLLEKYPTRWRLLHLKDIRQGAALAVTRSAPREDNVALGAGQIDWPAFLRAAEKAGVEYYFIEDESASPAETIPASVRYLHGLHY